MKKSYSIVMMSALALGSLVSLTACSSGSDVEETPGNLVYDGLGKAGVKSEFVISIPRSVVGTRMGNDETQSAGTAASFRGMSGILLIPYDVVPAATTPKFADIMSLTNIESLRQPGTLNYKVYADQYVPIGTKYFLFYGKSKDEASTMADKFRYGMIQPTGLTSETLSTPSNITFSLEQINTSTEQQAGNSTGRNVVQLLTSLANTTSTGAAPNNAWSTSNNRILARLYRNFIGCTVSSSNSVSAILGMIYAGVDRITATDPSYALATAIKDKITAACTTVPIAGSAVSLKSDYTGYPANIGLPDGAVRVRWDATALKFVDMTANYNQGLNVKITDYTYPAALWYFVSTPLKAANDIKSTIYDAETNWNNVINNVYSGSSDEVEASTLSVALKDPVQYAVGRIETKLTMPTGTFYDGAGKAVDTGSGFRLKGLLIGGQSNAAYDFTSKGEANKVIYDRTLATPMTVTPGNTTAANQTLALQTKKDQIIYAALELENGGEAFTGFDGIIPAGGTFYLTVKLDPKATTTTGYVDGSVDKIVIKDHVTKLTVSIKNGNTTPDRNGDGTPDQYIKDANGVPTGVDVDGDGNPDPYDIDGDGNPDTIITDPTKGGPGWDTDGDGVVDIPILPDPTNGEYPDSPNVPGGLGNSTNGIPDLSSPGIELGTSVDLEWKEGLTLEPSI